MKEEFNKIKFNSIQNIKASLCVRMMCEIELNKYKKKTPIIRCLISLLNLSLKGFFIRNIRVLFC